MWAGEKLLVEQEAEQRRRRRERRKAARVKRLARAVPGTEQGELLPLDAIGAMDADSSMAPLMLALRTTRPMRLWRRRVLRRAGGRCERCGVARQLYVDCVQPLDRTLRELGVRTFGDALGARVFRLRAGVALCVRCYRAKVLADARRYGWRGPWLGAALRGLGAAP